MKVHELTGAALDWEVAKCEGFTDYDPTTGTMLPPRKEYGRVNMDEYSYSTDWAQGGVIIEREDIAISSKPDGLCAAYAPKGTRLVQHGGQAVEVFNWYFKQEGYTPLIAAMRCYVASKQGEQDANETV